MLLSQSGGFPHYKHVVEQQAPCAVCHDAHGSRQNAHLINFMTRDLNGQPVVSPTQTGRLDYTTTSPGRGSCNLNCHGREHTSLGY